MLFGANLLGPASLLLRGLFTADGVERGGRARGAGRAGRRGRGLAVLQLDLLGPSPLLFERDLGAVFQDDGVSRLRLHRQSARSFAHCFCLCFAGLAG